MSESAVIDTQLFRWLYGLILVEDANFKQKARLRSKDDRDPALGPGWATFVANEAYLNHLATYVHQDEVNLCILPLLVPVMTYG